MHSYSISGVKKIILSCI
ncbi:CPXV047 protein [Cowpox virus]|uniref:CPXV047 protein n=1 Tax=Cowpox virus TaxID=10243 RepID=A0A290GNY5_COWPX|nr:CPXV047 protein [Cowpox virus]ATB55523.1 CPXV047 protein [Cowpox virus]